MAVFDDDEDVPDGKFATRLLQFDAAAPHGTAPSTPIPGIQVTASSDAKGSTGLHAKHACGHLKPAGASGRGEAELTMSQLSGLQCEP